MAITFNLAVDTYATPHASCCMDIRDFLFYFEPHKDIHMPRPTKGMGLEGADLGCSTLLNQFPFFLSTRDTTKDTHNLNGPVDGLFLLTLSSLPEMNGDISI